MIIFRLHDGLLAALTEVFAAFTDFAVNVADTVPNQNDPAPCITVGGTVDAELTGRVESDWHDMPYTNRDEAVQLIVSVLVQSGDTSPAGTRSRCNQLVEAVMAELTANPSVGVDADGMAPQFQKADLELRQGAYEQSGVWVEAILTLHFKAITAYL